jgi:hypothetical protein
MRVKLNVNEISLELLVLKIYIKPYTLGAVILQGISKLISMFIIANVDVIFTNGSLFKQQMY